MANLALNWILIQHNYTYVTIDENQKSIDEYFSILEESQIQNDKSIFINYIIRIEKENLKSAIQLIEK